MMTAGKSRGFRFEMHAVPRPFHGKKLSSEQKNYCQKNPPQTKRMGVSLEKGKSRSEKPLTEKTLLRFWEAVKEKRTFSFNTKQGVAESVNRQEKFPDSSLPPSPADR